MCARTACFGFGVLVSQAALTVGSSACCVVEQVGDGPPWCQGSGGGGGVVAEAAHQLHPYFGGVTPNDQCQEPVLRGDRQAGHPGGHLAGIVSEVFERWTCLGCDGE